MTRRVQERARVSARCVSAHLRCVRPAEVQWYTLDAGLAEALKQEAQEVQSHSLAANTIQMSSGDFGAFSDCGNENLPERHPYVGSECGKVISHGSSRIKDARGRVLVEHLQQVHPRVNGLSFPSSFFRG